MTARKKREPEALEQPKKKSADKGGRPAQKEGKPAEKATSPRKAAPKKAAAPKPEPKKEEKTKKVVEAASEMVGKKKATAKKAAKAAGEKLTGIVKRVSKALPHRKTSPLSKARPSEMPPPADAPLAEPREAGKPSPAAPAAQANPEIGTRSGAAVGEGRTARPKQTQSGSEDLPTSSAEGSRLVLMMRDPQTLHAFWMISAADRELYGLDRPGGAPPLLLRLYDREGENGARETYRSQIVVANTERWTIQVPGGGRSWRAELGFITREGHFQTIAGSNVVVMQGPAAAPTRQDDRLPERLRDEMQGGGEPEELEMEEVGLGGGAAGGGSRTATPVRYQTITLPVFQPGSVMGLRQIREALPGLELQMQPASMPGLAQPGSLAPERPGGPGKEKDYWLQVHTELILYGATVPGSLVTVQGVPVELHEDGTFALRFALPEGTYRLPVHAVSPDGDQERQITPVVVRSTED